MTSYDLTEDDRGLDLSGHLVNIDLVIIRNKAYALANEHDCSLVDNHDAALLYKLSQQLLES